MKRFFATSLFLFIGLSLMGQNLMNYAFDTNGPVGDVLFDQNDNGEIVYSGVVEVPFSADTLFGLAKEFLYDLAKKFGAEVSDRFEGVTKVACDIELPVGTRFIDVGYVGVWGKAASTVSFNLVIDIRSGKYRYTLSRFVTDRWRISGEGKDEGPSNLIHWQRVNSLTKELAETRSAKKKEELSEMLERERIAYSGEYNAVMDFIHGLESFTSIDDSF